MCCLDVDAAVCKRGLPGYASGSTGCIQTLTCGVGSAGRHTLGQRTETNCSYGIQL